MLTKHMRSDVKKKCLNDTHYLTINIRRAREHSKKEYYANFMALLKVFLRGHALMPHTHFFLSEIACCGKYIIKRLLKFHNPTCVC